MDTSKLIKAIKSIHPVSDNFKSTLEEIVIPYNLPKNHILLEPPTISDQLYFINRGLAMCYTQCKKKKNVEWFRKEGQFLLASQSFFGQKSSEQYIQLMRRSELLAMPHHGVERLLVLFPEAQRLFQLILLREYGQTRQYGIDIKFLEATERFEKLLKTFPDLDRTVPQESIASYLGITPQSFSRMKRER